MLSIVFIALGSAGFANFGAKAAQVFGVF